MVAMVSAAARQLVNLQAPVRFRLVTLRAGAHEPEVLRRGRPVQHAYRGEWPHGQSVSATERSAGSHPACAPLRSDVQG